MSFRGISLQWRHNEHDGVSNRQPHHLLLNRLFRRRSKKTSKLRVTGLCVGNLPVTGEFPAQMASNAENVSIWWRYHIIFSDRYSTLIFMLEIMCHLIVPTQTMLQIGHLGHHTPEFITHLGSSPRAVKHPPGFSNTCSSQITSVIECVYTYI